MQKALQRRPRPQSAPVHSKPSNSTTARYSPHKGCTWKSGPLAHSGSVYVVSNNTDLYKNRFVERHKPFESWRRDLKSVPKIGNVFRLLAGLWKHFFLKGTCASGAFIGNLVSSIRQHMAGLPPPCGSTRPLHTLNIQPAAQPPCEWDQS